MEKAEFKCQRCEGETKELNVHHVKYRKGADVWDYPDDQLVCLCERCHTETHEALDKMTELCSSTSSILFEALHGLACGKLSNSPWPWMYLDVLRRGFGEKFGDACYESLTQTNRLICFGMDLHANGAVRVTRLSDCEKDAVNL